MGNSNDHVFADRYLSQRLESLEAQANANFIDARRKLLPGCSVDKIQIAGGQACYDGATSSLTRSLGLGLFDTVKIAELREAEHFFRKWQVPIYHEVSTYVDPSLINLLRENRYEMFGYTNVLYLPLEGYSIPFTVISQLSTRRIEYDERFRWANVSATAWRTEIYGQDTKLFAYAYTSTYCIGNESFWLEMQSQPVATGTLFMHKDIGLLMNGSTVFEGRKQGAHLALLGARLEYLIEAGGKLAMIVVAPGSQAQRNAEKYGFRLAYTRLKWTLK